MARPKQETPTSGELEVLKVLWKRGPSTVREVLEELNSQGRTRAYTSVMSLMNVMADKQLLDREPLGRAFQYSARRPQEKTLGGIVNDILGRVFEGSAPSLVAHLLEESKPNAIELEEIRKALEQYEEENRA
ncbi:BlaI/MecI/CopY family transcriptional regulator [Bremerella sp. T1]|uniref:BlaI/MecI/CopY family transcriptional regulator n=1 Tax=Bremerella sp. TYQ1 TaxID=3119568 RepID=UPI001CCF9182|nr:BlaI/MecI/CopY family transcriptional regulator [Bremerella volcania]UBM34886.1 BlaI/MecI/CopY family transcriptional regulator [Bremerella volcania]